MGECMSHQVPWNEQIYMEFSRLAMLSPLEREILRTRIMGYSVVQQAMEFNISEPTVHRIISKLKKKYDAVQELSNVLPKRKSCAKELWQDNN